MGRCALLDNERAIRHVTVNYTDTGSGEFTVDENSVAAIKVVPVTGDGAYVPWFRVTHVGRMPIMLNARFVSCVVYAEE